MSFLKRSDITIGKQNKCLGNKANEIPVCSNMLNKPENVPLLYDSL